MRRLLTPLCTILVLSLVAMAPAASPDARAIARGKYLGETPTAAYLKLSDGQ